MEGRVLELASKAGRKEWNEQWKALRRGWYVGGESFAEHLQARLEKALQGRKRESHSGLAKAAHDEAAGERSLEKVMKMWGLDKDALHDLPKGSPEKVALAWWLRENTAVTLRWVSARLAMGHSTRVTQAIRRMSCRPARNPTDLKRKMAEFEPIALVGNVIILGPTPFTTASSTVPIATSLPAFQSRSRFSELRTALSRH